MAEFQYVMKQWRRMCEKNQSDCMRFCPICANPACGELTEASNEDIRKAEDAIMTWAAEHPEPVYPTWYEFMRENKIIPDVLEDCGDFYKSVGRCLVRTRIERDMAQKLGIEPKEVDRGT